MKGLARAVSQGCGGIGRYWLAESSAKGRSVPQFGSTASMYAGGVGIHRPGSGVTAYFGSPRLRVKPSFADQARMCFATVSP